MNTIILHAKKRLGKKKIPYSLFILRAIRKNNRNRGQKRREKIREKEKDLFFANFPLFHVIRRTVREKITYIKTK